MEKLNGVLLVVCAALILIVARAMSVSGENLAHMPIVDVLAIGLGIDQ